MSRFISATYSSLIKDAGTAGRALLQKSTAELQRAYLSTYSIDEVNVLLTSLAGTIPSLTGYATESYVDAAIAGIPIVDLSGYAQLSGATFTGLVQAPQFDSTATGFVRQNDAVCDERQLLPSQRWGDIRQLDRTRGRPDHFEFLIE